MTPDLGRVLITLTTMEIDTTIATKVKDALAARSRWESIDREIMLRRLGTRPARKKYPYDGAPNFVEPIIDDAVVDKTDQEISMLFNAPRMCHVAPVTDMSNELRVSLEAAFDSYLRYIIRIRPKIEESTDTKNERGFSIMKAVRNYNSILEQDVPDCEVCDILDLIVPPDTKSIPTAPWMVHVIRMDVSVFKERAEKYGFLFVEETISKCCSDNSDSSSNANSPQSTSSKTQEVIGFTTARTTKKILLWEYYGYATETDVATYPDLLVGRKMVKLVCPDLGEDKVLKCFPWRKSDSTSALSGDLLVQEQQIAAQESRVPQVVKIVYGADKPWPFVQNRFELRSRDYYNSRGIGHKCMDDQIAATQIRNMKAVFMDYTMVPLFQGDTPNTTNVNIVPGSVIPPGLTRVDPPSTVPLQFSMEINEHRASAGRRAGAAGMYNYSTNVGATRKVQKTATEVSDESERVSSVSSAAVDRTNEPLAELFQMIWDDMVDMKLSFPVIIPGESPGSVNQEWYKSKVMMVPAASAKTLNPDLQLIKSRNHIQFLAAFAQQVPMDLSTMLRTLNANYDPQLTRNWILPDSSPDGGQPLNVRLQTVEQDIRALAGGGKDLSERMKNLETLITALVDKIQGASGVNIQ